jgi:hypothetical protein
MSKKFQLQIPEPCHESWDKMTPIDKGRFCDSCQKAVHDFTGMSDAQLLAFFKKPSTGSVCGRFYHDQLDRDFEISRKKVPWIKYFLQLAIPVFLTTLKAHSQGNISLKERATPNTLASCSNSQIVTAGMVSLPYKSRKIFGLVADEKGNGISYATVFIQERKEGTMCDSNGFFQLENSTLDKKITVIASCVGYSSAEKQINIRKDDFTKITLGTNARLNGEVIVTATSNIRLGGARITGICVKKKTYLEKLKLFFAGDSIKISPNPAKAGSEIKIEWKKAIAGEYNMGLYSIQGQLIQSSSVTIEAQTTVFVIQISQVTPGSYVLALTNKKTGKKHSEKIIIQ